MGIWRPILIASDWSHQCFGGHSTVRPFWGIVCGAVELRSFQLRGVSVILSTLHIAECRNNSQRNAIHKDLRSNIYIDFELTDWLISFTLATLLLTFSHFFYTSLPELQYSTRTKAFYDTCNFYDSNVTNTICMWFLCSPFFLFPDIKFPCWAVGERRQNKNYPLTLTNCSCRSLILAWS